MNIYSNKSLQKIEYLNRILKENNQVIRIENSDLPLDLYILSNGSTEKRRKLAKRIESEFFIHHIDQIYSSETSLSEDLVKGIMTSICKKGGSRVVPWAKGLTKYDHSSLMKISNDRKGILNPVHSMSEESKKECKKKQSERMKEMIFNGEFTPKTSNRNTKPMYYDGRKFRSSWEIQFYKEYANKNNLEYEKIRIKWIDEKGKNRVYITDFVDESIKTIFEIKPVKFIEIEKIKLEQAEIWCSNNGYKFVLITEKELRRNKNGKPVL